MSALRAESLQLYRQLLRAGKAFPDYNVREYIVRKTKTGFRDKRSVSGAQVAAALKEAREQLALVQRQSTIAGFYNTEPSVMESVVAAKKKGARAASR